MHDRYLYLARHGQATPDETALTDAGRRQAQLLGERLRSVPLTAVHHGPLPRAAQTARLIGEQLDGVPLCESDAAGDYVPYVPGRDELPADHADFMLDWLAEVTEAERAQGAELARAAEAAFTGPVRDGAGPRHELVVTHAFLVAWLVRAALDSPRWRWIGLNQANTGLTVLRYAVDRPATVLIHNDQSHLPQELRWMDFPEHLRTP
ncbi:MAG: histidine phosphatase family protein [Kitasatospora sp.]|jgi:probable phosphoglycerate mutase|nr:histidine phosphatase family protein [Kitasatospora sp.]